MKKGTLALVVTASVIVLLVLLAALLVSPVAKAYIVRHSKELTGRQIDIEKLRINVFNGSLKMQGFKLKEADDATDFASLEEIDVRMSLPKLLQNKIIINKIHLDSLCVNIIQDGERFNFSDMIERFSPEAEDTTDCGTDTVNIATAWDLGIYDIALNNSNIQYHDIQVGADFGFNDMSLYIPGVYFSGRSTDVGLNLNLSDGGSIGMNLKYDMQEDSYNLDVKVREMKLEDFLPYVRQSFDISSLAGSIGIDLNIEGNLNHILEFSATGDAFAAGVDIKDRDSQLLAKADSLYVGISDISLTDKAFNLSKVYIDGLATRFILNPDSTNNFSYLLDNDTQQQQGAADSAGSTPDEPIRLHVDDFELRGGNIAFSDRMNVGNFDYQLRDITVACKDFSPDKDNVVSISSRLNRKGMVRMRWAGSLNNLDNQNLLIVLSNVDVKEFSPYCLKYFAYPLKSGTLSFKSQNVIKNRHLNGTNSLDLYNCEVDKKQKDIKSEYNIPLKAGIYVLKDKTGHINMDLPVSGSLDSPSFSYRKIIFKALVNVFVKVATAPFDFLAGGNKQLDKILLEPTQMMFTSEQYSKFDEIAQILRDKPEISIKMEQRINYGNALSAFAVNNLKREFYRYSNPDKQDTPLELIDMAQIEEINTKTPEFKTFVDTIALRNSLSDSQRKNYESVACSVYGQTAEQHLSKSMTVRNQLLEKYMKEQHKLSDSIFTVCLQPDDRIKQYTGKDMYKIQIEIAGETLCSDSTYTSEDSLRIEAPTYTLETNSPQSQTASDTEQEATKNTNDTGLPQTAPESSADKAA